MFSIYLNRQTLAQLHMLCSIYPLFLMVATTIVTFHPPSPKRNTQSLRHTNSCKWEICRDKSLDCCYNSAAIIICCCFLCRGVARRNRQKKTVDPMRPVLRPVPLMRSTLIFTGKFLYVFTYGRCVDFCPQSCLEYQEMTVIEEVLL